MDLAEQGVLLPDGTTIDFEIDPFAKRMILAGTDEIGYSGQGRRDQRMGGRPPAAGGHAHRHHGRRVDTWVGAVGTSIAG